MALLCGRAGRLTAENGGFRPGQEQQMAPAVHASLSTHGRHVCRHVLYRGPPPHPRTLYSKVSAESLGKQATAFELAAL